jgi:hypothetical protein
MDQPKVTQVRGEVLYKHTLGCKAAGLPATIAGYRSTAVMKDGTEEVLVARGTRHYAWAYQWVNPVAAGKSGLAAYFTYRNVPVTSPSALARFRIDWL